jgi:hypothetical protein
MAVYKVIQDIEAEDKFVGPLTLKQFIFAGITALCIYLSFIFISRGVWFLALPFLPFILVGGFLAFPWGRDQPTEIWLLAKLRFLFKPRRRIWDQTGVQELVTITAPKRDVTQYTNNLSQIEVKSRLRVLADTIDSRGWAIKNANVNLAAEPNSAFANQFSDRLVDASALPQEVANNDVYASDDIMDVQNNPLAQHLDQLINNSSQTHRQAAIQQMDNARTEVANGIVEPPVGAPAPNYWFINQPDPTVITPATMPAAPADNSMLPLVSTGVNDLSPEEKALLDKIHHDQATPDAPVYGHMRVIQPLSVQAKQQKPAAEPKVDIPTPVAPVITAPVTPPAPVTPTPDPAILELAINNDRDVASLAREANAKLKKDQSNEVVIKLR